MILDNDRALKVAEFLLQIKAIKLQPNDPFTWASGIKSPIYCDNRISLSYPAVRTFLRQAYCDAITEQFGKPDLIAGVATGGIAQGALIAQEMGLPFVYIRSEAKAHGMGNQIEGFYEEGQKVVVIEDLISTGKSSIQAIQAMKDANLNILGLVAIFTYGFKEAVDNFKAIDCPFVTLSNYDFLIEEAIAQNYVLAEDAEQLMKWKANPREWNKEKTV